MKAIGGGYYRDKRGAIYKRPWINGRRTWRKMSNGNDLREAVKKTLSTNKPEEIREWRHRWKQDWRKFARHVTTGEDILRLPSELEEIRDHLAEIVMPPIGQPGLYFLMDGVECVYVGQSKSAVSARILRHVGAKKFDRVLVMPCGIEHIDEIERYFISSLNPRYNVSGIDTEVVDILRRQTNVVDLNSIGSNSLDQPEITQTVDEVARPE